MQSLLHENMSSSQFSSDDDNNNYDEFNSNKSPLCYNSLKKYAFLNLPCVSQIYINLSVYVDKLFHKS